VLFDLPGGGSARICTKKDAYPDGRLFVGYGVQPDIEVKRRLAGYLEGRDPVLERARSFLRGE
jgi:C-terminal processing protease CtpA/Prc